MIEVRNLQRIFHVGQRQVEALRRVNQEVREGEFLVLLGSSGSGKTTLLRCIAGLETPDDGEILISGQPVFSKKDRIYVPPEDRQIGMVFQSYAIWPHMTVFDNVAVPLTYGRKRIKKHLVRDRVLAAHGMGLSAYRLCGIYRIKHGGGGQASKPRRTASSQPDLTLIPAIRCISVI